MAAEQAATAMAELNNFEFQVRLRARPARAFMRACAPAPALPAKGAAAV
jgi:hypothetical protein